MELKSIQNIYFVGIGGIGMSAIASYFVANGKLVGGYDKTPSVVTAALESQGVEVTFVDELTTISDSFLKVEDTLVIYTPAIPKESKILKFFLTNGYRVLKRAAILGEITKNTICYAVAGTHGKTTTSSILGHIMHVCGTGATSFLGGITENYNSNLILGEDKISVVEADEFDRSFLQLSPNIACITNMDADHLDIYGEKEALEASFREFAGKVSDTLIVKKGLSVEGLTYGVEEAADYQALNVAIEKGSFVFDVKTPHGFVKDVVFHLPGRHNVSNALVSIAMAEKHGLNLEDIKQALVSYKGVKRRFSFKIKRDDFVLIDDYAHHPTEIDAVENAVREMYPGQKILTVFQPHLFSRTRDFVTDFAMSLSKFDEVILLDIYPARELPIEGVTSEWLLDKIKNTNKSLQSKAKAIESVKNTDATVVVMLGAGDIGVLIEEVTKEIIG
ncbi:UDP-N-acetylmuramate--L-alanine ligase [Wenyingzhuangia sp. 2_MG-2023]|uniref:UDP-N-acetylmuramate--L-alanine ligase n=1 Tax=Wenyingzhuangia sp. 2_MG-2023 TaxID=3062639 RepID=UPI0026E3CBD9|nr:UDP-N-acetylmuramate--L-alanine ligase [Wenyingzhuangia sp. 2_MG-2023]MDO6737691.1 UDP-N-acetylmuramate--L-alanine ligase [Wenyingzhuangia sp. 2_MG-2023]